MTDINDVLDLMILAIEKQNKINEQFLKHIAILRARIDVLEAENKELKNDKLNAHCKEFIEGAMKHGKNVE
jgi:hypothetical protein